MTPYLFHRSTKIGGLLVLVCWVSLSNFANAACKEDGLSLRATQTNSQWFEHNLQQRQLVAETGGLPGYAAQFSWQCDVYRFRVAADSKQGTRLYDGVTNLGNAFLSTAQISQKTYQIQALRSFQDQWLLGLSYGAQITNRTVQGAGNVQGFQEQFVWDLLKIDLKKQWQASYGLWALAAHKSLGGQTKQQRFELSNRDAAILPLGKMSAYGAALELAMPLWPHWMLQTSLAYQKFHFEAGSDVVITQNGVPKGLAHQPQTTQLEKVLSVGLKYTF